MALRLGKFVSLARQQAATWTGGGGGSCQCFWVVPLELGKALIVDRQRPGPAVVVAMSAEKALRVDRLRPGPAVGVA